MHLVDEGPAGLSRIESLNSGRSALDSLHERLYLLFHENKQDGLATHYEFSRISTHIRESATCEAEWIPHLGLGTIVKQGDNYLVCIQPSCDAVRLTEPTQFIFAPLICDDAKFDLVVKSPEGNDVCLRLQEQASWIVVVTFEQDTESRTIHAVIQGSSRIFTAADGAKYTWIADLRTSFAQRMVHRIATNLSRIGLDEFEWQRARARRS
jgi:hypothetical protein